MAETERMANLRTEKLGREILERLGAFLIELGADDEAARVVLEKLTPAAIVLAAVGGADVSADGEPRPEMRSLQAALLRVGEESLGRQARAELRGPEG